MKLNATSTRIVTLAALILLALCVTTLRAQETRGVITGKVLDANKAIVPGAVIKITNEAQGTILQVESTDAGLFRAPNLLPGNYQLVVEVSGFKRYVRNGLKLQIGETVEVNVELEIGSVDQSVTITGETPTLDTASASAQQTIDTRRVAELPLVHGDPYTLIGLAPGVTFARDQRLDRPFEPTHIVGYNMDGVRANRSDLTIDGAPSTATANGNEVIASYVPPTDIIQEFKIQTATFDAQFGNTEGGVTSIGIKSGGNQLHGTAYLWKEPGNLAANDFFGNSRGTPRPDTHSDRFGATVTGPVWIPKLYNGRDRTFFTFGYEGIRDSRPRFDSTTPTVPTPAFKNGDFSALLALGSQYQIYNPFTRRADPARPGHFIQDPFPGNIIPANLINPVAKGLLKYFPDPKSAATASKEFLNNNADSTLAELTKRYDNFTIRIDHAIGQKHKLFGRTSWYDRDSFYNDYFGNIATGTTFQFISRQGVVEDAYTINPTTFLSMRYGYNRFIRAQDMNPDGWGFDLTSVGFPAAYNNLIDPAIRRFPRIDFTGTSTSPAVYQGTGQTGEFRPVDTHSVAVTLNKVLSSHALKTGVEFRSYRENDFFTSNNQTGQFVFDNSYTKQKDDSSATQVGLSFAAFLLGIPTASSGVVRAADYAEQSTTTGVFVQDDWKVNARLTLNLGLRYEIETPLTERYNKSVTGFDPYYIQPIESAVRAKYTNPIAEAPVLNVRGGLQFATSDHRGLYKTPKKNIMPRFGLAFKLNDKTVIRGGYGIFYGFLGERRGDVIQTGYSLTTNFVPTVDNINFATLSNPFPNGILAPTGSGAGYQTNLGNSISFFNQRPQAPYNQRWELGFQRELPGGFVAEVSYIGNRGTHIEINRDINAVPTQYLSTSPTRDTVRNAYLTGTVPNPFFGLGIPGVGSSSTISRLNLLKPFPEFGSITTTTNDGYSWYHAAQMRLEKRFSKGYTAQMSYTHSRLMQATEYLNAADPRPTEVISDQDYPNRLAFSGIAELPFGKNHKFLAGSNAVVSRIVGGWQVQAVYAYQSGRPLEWGNYIYNGDFHDIAISSDAQSLSNWFNTSGFERVNGNQLVNNVRTFPQRFSYLRVQPNSNVDFSLIKNTAITERVRFQFRAEFTNALNHPWLSAASGASGSSGVITVPTNASFGQITNLSNQGNYARRVQLGFKLLF